MIKGLVNSIESFGSVDGPGVRFMFFMQGCNMRCAYCHNPETWAKELPDTSESMVITPEEGFKMASRYKAYWKKGGGITVSGGEAMLQMEWVTEPEIWQPSVIRQRFSSAPWSMYCGR